MNKNGSLECRAQRINEQEADTASLILKRDQRRMSVPKKFAERGGRPKTKEDY